MFQTLNVRYDMLLLLILIFILWYVARTFLLHIVKYKAVFHKHTLNYVWYKKPIRVINKKLLQGVPGILNDLLWQVLFDWVKILYLYRLFENIFASKLLKLTPLRSNSVQRATLFGIHVWPFLTFFGFQTTDWTYIILIILLGNNPIK